MESSAEYLPSVLSLSEDVLNHNKENGWPDVTPKAKKFLHEYAIAGDFRAACSASGLKRSHGSRLLRDPLNSGYLTHIQENLMDHTIITRQFVELEMLKTLEELGGEVDIPNVTKEGDIVWGPRYNGSGKVSLLKEMKGLAGMNKEQGVDGHGVTIIFNEANFTGSGPSVEIKDVDGEVIDAAD